MLPSWMDQGREGGEKQKGVLPRKPKAKMAIKRDRVTTVLITCAMCMLGGPRGTPRFPREMRYYNPERGPIPWTGPGALGVSLPPKPPWVWVSLLGLSDPIERPLTSESPIQRDPNPRGRRYARRLFRPVFLQPHDAPQSANHFASGPRNGRETLGDEGIPGPQTPWDPQG